MTPEEFPKRPPHGRPPHRRRPLSVDGFTAIPMRRPPLVTHGGQRAVLSPLAASPAPQPLPVPAPPPHHQPPAPHPTMPAAQSSGPAANAAAPPQESAAAASTAPAPEQPPLQFVPPPARKSWRRRLLPIGLISTAVLVIAAGAVVFFRAQARQHDPALAFNDALSGVLSTPRIQVTTTGSDRQSQASFDFGSLSNPIVSTQATIQQSGANFGVQAYGSAASSYISYQAIPASITKPVSQAAQNAWVQLRAKGVQAAGVSAQLASLADPRYQAFGPVILGNYSLQTRTQLAGFLQDHKVYDYDVKSVSSKTLGGSKVFVYAVKLNIAYLKIASQSAATSNKFTVADLQAAMSALDSLKGASATFYVSAKTHQLQQIDLLKDGRRTVLVYDHYNSAVLPDEPQTKLAWNDFARLQWQMEAQAAAQQPASARDSVRKDHLDALHSYLASYFTQNTAYPSQAQLNNQTWATANLAGLDPELLRDPEALNLQLADTPKAGSFAYQPVSLAGKPGCDASGTNVCAHYTLTALLSNGQRLTIQDP